ncbi:hypothetical protein BST61_g8386 [Cercospora zeina]
MQYFCTQYLHLGSSTAWTVYFGWHANDMETLSDIRVKDRVFGGSGISHWKDYGTRAPSRDIEPQGRSVLNGITCGIRKAFCSPKFRFPEAWRKRMSIVQSCCPDVVRSV